MKPVEYIREARRELAQNGNGLDGEDLKELIGELDSFLRGCRGLEPVIQTLKKQLAQLFRDEDAASAAEPASPKKAPESAATAAEPPAAPPAGPAKTIKAIVRGGKK